VNKVFTTDFPEILNDRVSPPDNRVIPLIICEKVRIFAIEKG
jgi:hypothetical protein